MRTRLFLMVATLLLSCLPALAAPLDLTTARVDNVALGFTEKQAHSAVGWEHKNTDEAIEFHKMSPMGRVTVKMADGKVVAVLNGTMLDVKGAKRLRVGDDANVIQKVLGPTQVQKDPSTTQYPYKQNGTRVVVVVQQGKIAGFFLDFVPKIPMP